MQTLVIKKYMNRKLYNTATHKYVSLSFILDLLKSNTEFLVVNHNKQDITRSTAFEAASSNLRVSLSLETLRDLLTEGVSNVQN